MCLLVLCFSSYSINEQILTTFRKSLIYSLRVAIDLIMVHPDVVCQTKEYVFMMGLVQGRSACGFREIYGNDQQNSVIRQTISSVSDLVDRRQRLISRRGLITELSILDIRLINEKTLCYRLFTRMLKDMSGNTVSLSRCMYGPKTCGCATKICMVNHLGTGLISCEFCPSHGCVGGRDIVCDIELREGICERIRLFDYQIRSPVFYYHSPLILPDRIHSVLNNCISSSIKVDDDPF